MSKRTKRLALLIALMLCLTLLAACGATDAADTSADSTEAADTTETAEADATEADSSESADAGTDETSDAAADSYTVIFDSRGGTEVAPFTAPAGQPLHLSANPVKEGCTFLTWEDQWGMPIGHGAENTDVEWYTEAGQEITLYAVWE